MTSVEEDEDGRIPFPSVEEEDDGRFVDLNVLNVSLLSKLDSTIVDSLLPDLNLSIYVLLGSLTIPVYQSYLLGTGSSGSNTTGSLLEEDRYGTSLVSTLPPKSTDSFRLVRVLEPDGARITGEKAGEDEEAEFDGPLARYSSTFENSFRRVCTDSFPRIVGAGEGSIFIVPGGSDLGAAGRWEKKEASFTDLDQTRFPRACPTYAHMRSVAQ